MCHHLEDICHLLEASGTHHLSVDNYLQEGLGSSTLLGGRHLDLGDHLLRQILLQGELALLPGLRAPTLRGRTRRGVGETMTGGRAPPPGDHKPLQRAINTVHDQREAAVHGTCMGGPGLRVAGGTPHRGGRALHLARGCL